MACHFSEPGSQQCSMKETSKADEAEGNSSEALKPKSARQCCSLYCGEPSKVDPAILPAVQHSDRGFKEVKESHRFAIHSVTTTSDNDRRNNTELLENRAREVERWQTEIKSAVFLLQEENDLLEGEKRRLLRAMKTLQVPQSILLESITRRSYRIGHDLVHDIVDATLNEGDELCRDLRKLYSLFLGKVNAQLEANKTCIIQLEFDWSDKTEDYFIETTNISLKSNGPISFFPGATRLPANQSTPQHWVHYTKELVRQGQCVLNSSQNLRKTLDDEISKATADLQRESDCVDLSLQRNIASTHQDLQETELKLTKVLSQITETETVHGKLAKMARQIDFNLKIAQTRLSNRNMRPRAENTRDEAQFSLLHEVQHLNEAAVRIQQEIEATDATLKSLYHSQALLENNVSVKRKSIYIDNQRTLACCRKFPDSSALSGYNII